MKTTKAQLQQDLINIKAQSLNALDDAYNRIPRTSTDVFFGSGVVLSIATLDGSYLVDPVCITDGLSSATIEAIMKDLKRSAQLKVSMCSNLLK